MLIKLHGVWSSPAVRASMFTLDALNLSYEFVEVDTVNKEQMNPEFLKMNPLHTVPVLVDDDGFVVYDSHAINAYLVNKYAKDDKLYPEDPKKRSIVDRRMFFDNGVLFGSVRNIMLAILREKTETKITEKMVTNVEDNCYAVLEKFLADGSYAAGNEITIADFSIASTLANTDVIIPIDREKFPLVIAYMERCKENIVNYEDVTSKAMKMFENNLKRFDFPFRTPKA